MKNKTIFLFLSFLIIISIGINSCKKESQLANVQSLFSGGTWHLASEMQLNYLGSNQLATDTLNTDCNTSQLFTFKSDGTCTYSNYGCVPQLASGGWELSSDGLYLTTNLSFKGNGDTTNIKAFSTCKIVNLGNYSMVLQAGDISVYPSPTTKRTIYQYGFIRQTTPASN